VRACSDIHSMFAKKKILPGVGKASGNANYAQLSDGGSSLPGEVPPSGQEGVTLQKKSSLTRQLSHQINSKVRDVFGGAAGGIRPARGAVVEDVPEDAEERRVRDLREAFELFDKDNSGSISAHELASVMRALGQNPTAEEIEDMVNGIDDNSDGEIDFQEFVSLYSGSMNNADDEEFIAWAFESFDTDKSGKLSADEVRRIVLSMGDELSEEEVAEIMDRADLDGDGLLSFQEFTRLIIGD